MNKPTFSSPAQEIEQRRRAVRASPRNAQAHALLGMALQKHGHYAEAVPIQKRALTLDPKLFALHGVMAAAQFELGDFQGAADSYRRALAKQPNDAALQRGLSEALRLSGQLVSAVDSAQRAVDLAPQDVESLLALAQARHVASDFAAAADGFRQVTEIAPDHLGAWIDRGQAEHRARRFDDALRSFARALELDPDNVQALSRQGLCLRDLRRNEAAEASLRRAVELDPGNAAHWCEVGVTLQQMSRASDARPFFERSLELDPDRIATLFSLTHHYFEAGRWEDALRLVRRTMTLSPSATAHSTLLFILSHATLDGEELRREHFSFGEMWETPLRAGWKPHPNERNPARKVRVGFVSADLRHHAVTRFVEPIFGMLRHSDQLEFYVYSNSKEEDAVTERLRTYMPNWRSIAGESDERAEAMIRADAIDILVDLSGHSASNRLSLFACKPAPIQCSWIGYAGSTGLQAMDYYISDQFHLPEGRYDDQFTEQIVRLPLSAPFLPPNAAPDVNPLPAIANGYITFGSFHRASKISRPTVALWASLLRGVPDSKLLLGGQSGGSETGLLAWFAEEGIARERILVRPRVPTYEYMAQHHEVDVCLSPFPYSGSTTICYALWMGIPTLVTVGPTNPSHSAVCYLAHLGLSSFLANDDTSFVALGNFLRDNSGTLSALRGSMRERFTNSVVGYPGVAAAGIESALRRMWLRWCDGEAPSPLRVRLSDLGNGEQAATEEASA
ncbi:tetratricopeptide repeat protein [Massilia sp. CFBP9026]|uniref:O-linked N-acetylglucosamine transferase family protein n=1 Tax=Massilia sp. CFBP9026 TaxID=3096536 RepID=UPI002A6A4B51|nr:tetratricopeptide repeat protein [Massilia sp. CFBP9026]MDY0965573.1 tetratricopeptide repeat protein [Massilia sp. CFBP9026]